MTRTHSIASAALLTGWIGASVVSGASPGATDVEFFEARIRPVLVERCYPCHSARADRTEGGLRVDARQALRAGGDSGPAVVPGDPDASWLWQAIDPTSVDLQMPPADSGEPLPPAVLADFRQWITSGAADPRDALPLPPAQDLQAARDHWAFQPLARPKLPAETPETAGVRPLDLLVRIAQAALGIDGNPPADRRTLLRRVTYGLTGLPPTIEEVEAFLRDESPDAYDRVVERLLASPTYGQRWGRLWLDVARYSDTKGYLAGGQQQRFSFSHTYRDWVIDAFNQDKPLPDFLKAQIAADQLPLGEDKSDLAALGFLTLGRRFLNNPDDIIDDRIDVVTRGMLGLTVTCARCHDHKFDPIPTADYYALHGVFASSEEPAELPLLGQEPPPERYQEFLAARKEIENQIQAKREELIDAFLSEHRSRGGDYLWGAALAKSLPPDSDFELFAGGRQLHPHLLRRWIAFVDDGGLVDNALFDPWRQAADLKTAAAAYNKIFQQAAQESSEVASDARQFLTADGSPTNPPRDEVAQWVARTISERTSGMKQELEALNWKHDGAPLRAMALVDRARPRNSRILLRGKRGNPGPEVPRQFLAALSPAGRTPFQHGSGRRELAEAVANHPLAARVFVNRVWGWHFGQPLVDTPSDFGVRTPPPLLVDVLEWLTADLMEQGGSVKHLHRRIVLSETYRQSSAVRVEYANLDPENRTLRRFGRLRLDFESLRDTLLAVSGSLDASLGGLPVELTSTPAPVRRTVYGYIDRQNLPGVFRTFDFPNPDASSPGRFRTTVPQQALFMLNSPFVLEQADRLAGQIRDKSPQDAVEHLYRAILQRPATTAELELGEAYLAGSDDARRTRYCQTLLMTNELMFID
jgi:hypothetical protein